MADEKNWPASDFPGMNISGQSSWPDRRPVPVAPTPLTVEQVIARLKAFPPEASVFVSDGDGCFAPIEGWQIQMVSGQVLLGPQMRPEDRT